jgi:hypothetical protein
MSVINYPNGGSLTSTALTRQQIESAFQIITAQSLGLVMIQVSMALVAGSPIANPSSMANLAVGQLLIGPDIPSGVPAPTIIAVGTDTITMSESALNTATDIVTVASPSVSSQVRVGWQQQGQPGPSIYSDTVTVYCNPVKKEYSNMRDITRSGNEDTVTHTDVFTRCWRTSWVFYGPDALDNARAVRSALMTQQFTVDFLSALNLYIKADVEEPDSFPENFQGSWWERADLSADFNEQITETWTIGTVGSVEVKVYDDSGLQKDFVVTE